MSDKTEVDVDVSSALLALLSLALPAMALPAFALPALALSAPKNDGTIA